MTAEELKVLSEAITMIPRAFAVIKSVVEDAHNLRNAIVKHHSQKADDRCWLDDDELYAAAGLPVVDRRVGDKAAMRKNCERFIALRCEAGGWPSYADLEDLIRGLILNSVTDTSGLTPKQLELYEKFFQAFQAGE